MKTFWPPERSSLTEAEDTDASVLARPGDFALGPDQLRSGGVGWLPLRSPSLASAFADVALTHPLPGQGEIRETQNSPWKHWQKQDSCYLFAFSVVAGPQTLPEKPKAHFAGRSLSFLHNWTKRISSQGRAFALCRAWPFHPYINPIKFIDHS